MAGSMGSGRTPDHRSRVVDLAVLRWCSDFCYPFGTDITYLVRLPGSVRRRSEPTCPHRPDLLVCGGAWLDGVPSNWYGSDLALCTSSNMEDSDYGSEG